MRRFLILLVLLPIWPVLVQSQTISTVAGGAISPILKDGPATNIAISNPYGLTIDNIGNIYFADRNNHAIRHIDTNGQIWTIAGTGQGGYSGDGKKSIKARLDYPICVTLDTSGNLYFSDRYNNCIRKISPAVNGIISTVAGNGVAGFSGEGSKAKEAQLYAPGGIVIDEYENLVFCDAHNNCIRKVNKDGIITTIAGTGNKGYKGDGGLAINAELNDPYFIACNKEGEFYFTEYGNMVVRKIDKNGTITTIAGNGTSGFSGDKGPAKLAKLNYPTGIALDDSGNIYIADSENDRIRRIDKYGIINTIAGTGKSGFSGDGGLAIEACLSSPTGLALDHKGNLFFSDLNNNRIRRISNPEMKTEMADKEVYVSIIADPEAMTLYFDFNEHGDVIIQLLDPGNKLIEEQHVVGKHDATFDVKHYKPGLYNYSVKINGKTRTGKFKLE